MKLFKSKKRRILVVAIIVVAVVVACVIGAMLYELNTVQIRQTKDFASMYVDEHDRIDADAMITPPEKYSQLLQIDLEMRTRVAEYMKQNNLKLKCGKQEFVRINPTFEELIGEEFGFKFEPIGH